MTLNDLSEIAKKNSNSLPGLEPNTVLLKVPSSVIEAYNIKFKKVYLVSLIPGTSPHEGADVLVSPDPISQRLRRYQLVPLNSIVPIVEWEVDLDDIARKIDLKDLLS